MTLQDFTKTNGIMREVEGQPIYTMEFNAKIKTEQKCGLLVSQPSLSGFIPFVEFQEYIDNPYYVKSKKTILYQGAIISYNGKIIFEKTENGWRSTDCSIGEFSLLSNEISNSEFTVVGTVKSWFMADGNTYVNILSNKSEEVIVEISASNGTELNFSFIDLFKVGLKIGIIGQFRNLPVEKGKTGLAASKIVKIKQ